MDRSLVIIGAGVAGLSAGCYAAGSGYRTTILEMGAVPGGLCTSWRRRGYLFDGSVAGLAGSAPGVPIYRLWQELGVIEYCPLYDADNFGSIVAPDGRTVTEYTNIDRLEAELLGNFPLDAAPIRDFIAALRSCLRLDLPFPTKTGLAGLAEGFVAAGSALRSLPPLMKYGSLSLRDFIKRLADPFCVEVFRNLVHFGGLDVPLLTVLIPIAYSHRRMTGFPREGWLSFGRAIERRFGESGGEIVYGAKVSRLRTSDGKVLGVETEGGDFYASDLVISAADGRFTRRVLLGEAEDARKPQFDPSLLSDQPIQVNLGVAEDWSGQTGPLTYLLPESPVAGGQPQARITVHNKYYDPKAAPPGASALTVFLDSSWTFWKELEAHPSRYAAEKARCADLVIGAIAAHRPGFAARVELVEVATPLTRERFTGNWRGAMQARRPDSGIVKALLRGGPRYDWPGLEGFYMAGQWVETWGGITTAAQSGRRAIQALCRRDGLRFIT